MAGQVAAIALVVAIGVMVLVISVSARQSIALSQQSFYQQYNFADVFVDVVRAPDDLVHQVREMPGVNIVESRVRVAARAQVDGFDEPVQAELLSLPDREPSMLNQLYYVVGQPPAIGANEVVVSAPFAQAHDLAPGDSIGAIINGRLQTFSISGVALSPEYIYQLGPGSIMPDYERFGVFWMSRQTLAAAFDMDGAFNNLTLTLQPGVTAQQVIPHLDALLKRYGSAGAFSRDDQMSHRFVDEELAQLGVIAWILPTIFIAVAAFLLSVILARIIRTQRQSIALLKAFGYHTSQVIAHYGQLAATILLLGYGAGVVLGWLVAEPMAQLYATYFRFPEFVFQLQLQVLGLAFITLVLAGAIATVHAVSAAARMRPAEAMRPPAPVTYQQSRLETWLALHWLSQSGRMVLRHLARHPVRAWLSILGISLSGGLLLLSSYQFHAVDTMLTQQYRQLHRMDVTLTFTEVRPSHSLTSLQQVPGIQYVEGYRQVPIELSNGTEQWRLPLMGLPGETHLRWLTQDGTTLPDGSLAINQYLAQALAVDVGDLVEVQVLTGRQQALRLPITHIIDEPLGVGVYTTLTSLNQWLMEGSSVSGAWLLVDESQQRAVFEALHGMPMVASIGHIGRAEADIRGYIDNTVLGVMAVMFVLAGSMTFAVVYNNARVVFAERERELSTLRVLGYRKSEVAAVIVSELVLLVAIAIPIGWAIGVSFAWLMTMALSMDLFRIPFVLTPQSFGLSALGVVLAAVISLALMVRRVWQMDMLNALKTE